MYEAQMREDIKQLIAIIGELMYHIWMLENEKPVEKPQRNTYWEAKSMLDQLAHRYGIEHREN